MFTGDLGCPLTPLDWIMATRKRDATSENAMHQELQGSTQRIFPSELFYFVATLFSAQKKKILLVNNDLFW